MSLGPLIFTEPDEADVTPAERCIYRAFIQLVPEVGTLRAGLRVARNSGVSRRRVMEIVRKVNKEAGLP